MKRPIKKVLAKRSSSRLGAVQALYQMEVAGTPLPDVLAQFEAFWLGRTVEGETYKAADAEYFRAIVTGVLNDQYSIDQAIDAALSDGWPLKRIEALLRAVLRAGDYELGHCPEVPGKVVIMEYADVAAAFFDAEECRMVTGVLNALARKRRGEGFAAAD